MKRQDQEGTRSKLSSAMELGNRMHKLMDEEIREQLIEARRTIGLGRNAGKMHAILLEMESLRRGLTLPPRSTEE